MAKIKILCIAPYEGLGEAINAVSQQYSDSLDITTVVRNLNQSLVVAEEAEKKGYDAIISRGGTTELLQENVSLPVINIDVSGYDYLRMIRLAENIVGLKAFIGFSYITQRAKSINDLLHTDIRIFTIQKQEEIEPLLCRLNREGYSLIIGDVAACHIAEELAMNGMLLTSGRESIDAAFERAIQTVKAINRWKDQLTLADTVLRRDKHGIVVFDKNVHIIYKNEPFDALQISKHELAGYIGNTAEIKEQDMVIKRAKSFLQVSVKEIDLSLKEPYYALYIMEYAAMNPASLKGVTVRNFKIRYGNISDLVKQNGIYDEDTIAAAASFCRTNQAMLISGEPGVGKIDLAMLIHRYSERWNTPFVDIDCRIANPVTAMDELCFSREDPVLSNGATICFESIETVPRAGQEELLARLERLDSGRWRFIATSRKGLNALLEQDAMNEKLIRFFSGLSLYIPGLEKTRRDINKVVNLYLIEANTKLGRQVVGIEDAGMEYILRHHWKNNFQELKNAVNQMVLLTRHSMISLEDVKTVIRAREAEGNEGSFDLTGTLEEIELRVIRKVLEEEKGNYSKAAERLGIGRSTLWRKLGSKK